MIFLGTEVECAEVIAELDADLGFPRGYTQEDVDSGLVRFYGPGPHPPLEALRTETAATAVPVEVLRDEQGRPILDGQGRVQPTSDERRAKLPGHLMRPEHKQRVGRKRVLRLLNRGSRDALVALPGIGPARADALIARREQGRMTRLDDLTGVIPPAAIQALREYAHTKIDDEDDEVARAARKAKP